MEANMLTERGDIFVEGIDTIIRRDLEKHKSLLEMNNLNIQALQGTRSSEIARKQFYGEQKGKRKYRDEDMDIAIGQMNKNIVQLSIRIKLTEDMRKENTHIIDTLTQQLEDYNKGLKAMAIRKN